MLQKICTPLCTTECVTFIPATLCESVLEGLQLSQFSQISCLKPMGATPVLTTVFLTGLISGEVLIRVLCLYVLYSV